MSGAPPFDVERRVLRLNHDVINLMEWSIKIMADLSALSFKMDAAVAAVPAMQAIAATVAQTVADMKAAIADLKANGTDPATVAALEGKAGTVGDAIAAVTATLTQAQATATAP